MNEMDKNKLSINNFSKLITQEQFLKVNYSRTISSKRTMFSREQWLKLPKGTIMFPREKRGLN
jgi:hypothetical protein